MRHLAETLLQPVDRGLKQRLEHRDADPDGDADHGTDAGCVNQLPSVRLSDGEDHRKDCPEGDRENRRPHLPPAKHPETFSQHVEMVYGPEPRTFSSAW